MKSRPPRRLAISQMVQKRLARSWDSRPAEWGPIIILRGNNPQDRMSALGQKQTSKHCPVNVRFTPKSGHRNSVVRCPLCAKSRHWAPQQKRRYSILVRQLLPAATCGGPPEPRSKSNRGESQLSVMWSDQSRNLVRYAGMLKSRLDEQPSFPRGAPRATWGRRGD